MRRTPELDALRGLGAILIIMYHWRFRLPISETIVDLFFVLSGYLITSILLNTERTAHAFQTFYVRRALRIFPIYYLLIVVVLILRPLSRYPHPIDGLPYFLTYTQFVPSYWGGTMPAISRVFGNTWTLAMEEQFYLVWPMLVWALGRRKLMVLLPLLLVMPALLRFRGMDEHLLLTRCDGTLLGALLATVLPDGERLERRRSAFGIAFVLIALPTLIPLSGLASGPTGARLIASLWFTRVNIAYACLVGLLVLNAGHPVLRPLRARWLCQLGLMSYGLYLYHPAIFNIVTEIFARLGWDHHPMRRDVVKLSAAFGAAWLSWRYFERPILALKDRFRYLPAKDRDPTAKDPRVALAHAAHPPASPHSQPQVQSAIGGDGEAGRIGTDRVSAKDAGH